MSTFSIHGKKKLSPTFINIVIFALVIVVFMSAISYTAGNTMDRQEEALVHALERNIVQCYAENGFYPPSLDYMTEHYGLIYDESSFFVDYTPVGGNIYPTYRIVRLGTLSGKRGAYE